MTGVMLGAESDANASEQTKEAIKKLHDGGFVFGDLRPPNVLFSGGRVLLIDFDWAGKSGEAQYPCGLSRNANQRTRHLWK